MIYGTYTDARDLFEGIREAARERAQTERQIERLSARRSIRSSSFAVGGRGPRRDVNGTAASIALVDYESMMRQRIDDDERLIDLGARIVYGEDGRTGLAAVLGSAYADVLFWRYLNDSTWESTGSMCSVSAATAKRRAFIALDAIDAAGIERIERGIGATGVAGSLAAAGELL